MLDDFNELQALQQVLRLGSLTAAARALDVSVAVVSKRLSALEKRVGVRLVNRTTRSLYATHEGEQLLVHIDQALTALQEGEEMLAAGRDEPVGMLRVSAPTSFGRRHVAPVLGRMRESHPRLSVSLSLDDRLIDVTGGTVDVAVRIGGIVAEGGATMRKLADNRRVLVAAPAYLDSRGRPADIDDLATHEFLRYGDVVGPWRLYDRDGRERPLSISAGLRVNSGDVIQDWCVAGLGIMFKSEVDILADLRAGTLERVLPDWHGGDTPIVALFSDRSTMPRKTRVFLEAMAAVIG